jgi:DNA-binding transcriptional MerR regulator
LATYNIDEACRLSGISVRSLRNYVHHYGEFLHLQRGPYNALIFTDESLSVLVKIKGLLRDGKNRHQIREILSGNEEDPTLTIKRNDLPASDEHISILQILQKMDSTICQLAEENSKLSERVRSLESTIRKQRISSHGSVPALPSSEEQQSSRIIRQPDVLSIPLPHSLISLKDAFVAVFKSFRVFFRKSEPRKPGSQSPATEADSPSS